MYGHPYGRYLPAMPIGRAVCLAVMLPATFCAGMTLPLITRTLYVRGAGTDLGLDVVVNYTGGDTWAKSLKVLKVEPYSPAARAGYRALLAAGMVLRLAALPVRPNPPRPRGESARAYLRVLGLALGFAR